MDSLDPLILQQLNEIGIALSKEESVPRLLEKILQSAKVLTRADGGTLYSVIDGERLHFEIVMTDSLGYHLGGTSSYPIPFDDLPLFLERGVPNDGLIAAYAVNHKQSINIADAYTEEGFDFTGTCRFDQQTGYRTRSVLTVPMKNHEGSVMAVLQLINPVDSETGEILVFSKEDVDLAESLASQAGIALNNRLLLENLRQLFESLIHVVSEAIDEKSPFTGNHSKRVPHITELLAEAVNATDTGPLKDIHFTEAQLHELKIAALLHDCGKITTPVHIMEKRTKLETIVDRIEAIDARFHALKQREEKALLQEKLEWLESRHPQTFEEMRAAFESSDSASKQRLTEMEEERELVHRCNQMAEPITEAVAEQIRSIASNDWKEGEPLLTNQEQEALSIPRGNLTEKERKIIEHHVVMTYRMLTQLPFPKDLKAVPEIAASHHERMDGKGYPRGLKGEEMLVQARILAIADVFESLSAPDRPYRKAAPLSQVFKTMESMVEEGQLDPELFAIFLEKKAYLPYAKIYLTPEQSDLPFIG